MSKKTLKARQAKAQALGEREARARCHFCKTPLHEGAFMAWGEAARYCDAGCWDADRDVLRQLSAAREARR